MISRGRGEGSSEGGPVVETGLEVGEVTVRSLTSEVQLELVEVLEVDCIPQTRRLVGD